MPFIEDAIKALYGDMPVKLVQSANSKLDWEAFVKRDKDGKVVGVVVTDHHEDGEEVKPPPLPEKSDHTYEKPESTIAVKSEWEQAKLADEVKP